jgi:hypothetical protein
MRAQLLLFLLLGAFGLSGALLSQQGSPSSVSLPMQIEMLSRDGIAQPVQDPQPANQDPAQPKADPKAAKRLAAFKKLVFDRRPSSMLKAWAAPELKPYDPSEEEKSGRGDKLEDGGQAGGEDRTGSAADPNEKSLSGSVMSGAMGPAVKGRVGGRSSVTTTLRAMPVIRAVRTTTPVVSGGVRPPPSGQLTPAQIQELIDGANNDSDALPSPTASGAPPVSAAVSTDAKLEAMKLKREMEILQRDVTLGRWQKLAEFLGSLPEKDQKGAYEHVLKVLPRHPNKPPSRLPSNLQERNRFSFEDAFVLAAMVPESSKKASDHKEKLSKLLSPIIRRAIDDGSVKEEFLRLLGVEVTKPTESRRLNRREAALLLSALGMRAELGAFLPTAAEAEKSSDREALNLLARYALAKYAEEKRNSWLETAWQVTQAALAEGDISKFQKEEALRRAVELAPKVGKELGPEWLAQSFTSRPERGMEIIATIGGQVAKGFQTKARDVAYRTAGLQLQKTAVEALLRVAPELAEKWRPTLGLLASGWIHEAAHSNRFSKTTSSGSYMERDIYGNIFYRSNRSGGGGQVQVIEPADLLEAQPSQQWASLLSEEVLPHFTTLSAQLWLKLNEYEKAYPYIEQLASSNPRKAKELANEFLVVWKRSNNPNSSNRTNNYMFMFGFEQRANAIPLTRAKQERNLRELAAYVERLRALPIGGVEPRLLTEAFVAAHSSAEVYQLETIERVFGDIDELDPVVLGELIGKMRTNLATVWRVPAVQEKAKTRRSQQEMLEEVQRGYATALTLAEKSLKSRGRHWALLSAVATLMHDKNNFSMELKRNSDFADIRKSAFELFAEAADHYSSIADGLTIDEESETPFTLWFYAALGAADLGAVDESMVVAKSQLPLIKEALAGLPDGSRERHETRFANLLFTRMSAVKPQIKFRYLQAGFEIAADHEQTREAQKIWQYYQDLLAELRLEVVVDGATEVGTEPFGVRVDIVHTKEVSRESGGFQKYATNQNNMAYAYNYGRPTENYRDKFHDAAIAALRENFEILSVTFNSENMEPLRAAEEGWQRTPYAYLLLQARGPQVDRIPQIKMDLDFRDMSGFTILAIGSSPVVVDASVAQAERPFADLEVTQLLDERRADEGKITLEIKAKGKGMVPDLEAFLDLKTPGLVIRKSDDQGASVMRFSDDQDAIESERVWLLAMEPEDGQAAPSNFRFGEPVIEGVSAVYQRYNDADLETVSAEVALRRVLIANNPAWAWVLLALAIVLYLAWFFYKGSSSTPTSGEGVLRMPEQLTAFSVIALLERVRDQKRLEGAQQDDLDADIRRIESGHFSKQDSEELDLQQIARHWLSKAS